MALNKLAKPALTLSIIFYLQQHPPDLEIGNKKSAQLGSKISLKFSSLLKRLTKHHEAVLVLQTFLFFSA